MTAYATVTELNTYLPAALQVPTTGDGAAAAMTEAERLLARASELIDDVVRARYAVDDTGAPTDTTIAAVFRDATVRQYEHWLEVGESNAIDGLAGAQIAVDGFSGPRAPLVGPRALGVLRRAGLLDPVAWAESTPGLEVLP